MERNENEGMKRKGDCLEWQYAADELRSEGLELPIVEVVN